jgi:RNA polymerase sigma-70 factor (ECF subfamily)
MVIQPMSRVSSSSMSSFPPDVLPAQTAAIRAGDEDAFRQLFDALHGPLLGFASSFSKDDAVAQDVVQEAFVRLWDRRQRLDEEIPLRAWLFRTVRNLALNIRRDDTTRARLLDDPAAVDSAAAPRATALPDVATEGAELQDRVAVLVTELPNRQREALLLSRVEGLSHAEVAAAMGCAPRTVNNHLVAALSTLRRRLAEVGTLVASLSVWLP